MKNENFVVYGQWLDAIHASISDESLVKEIVWRIVEYGCYGAYADSDDSTVNLMLQMVIPQIDLAKENYEARVLGGKTAGRKKTVDDETVRAMAGAGKSAAEIAAALGVTRDAIYHCNAWKNRNLKNAAGDWNF